MIFVGNQRGGGKNLADHLMNTRDNDHVEVHEVRGFASETVHGAFKEAYAISRGTHCKQYLYSLSVNPPPGEKIKTEDFETAIGRAEERLNLTGQSRVIVFHEKEGRRHAHVVWSRIDIHQMKALQISHDRPKLMTVSRELYVEHGWKMPRGMVDRSQRDPKNFTLSEWQQARRKGNDPRAIKGALQDAWAISDSKLAFKQALLERGMILARGDRRSFVVVDRGGGLHALGKKTLGINAAAVRKRLGKIDDTLPDVEDAQRQNAAEMRLTVERLSGELEARCERAKKTFATRKTALIEKQRAEREKAFRKIQERHIEETRDRHARFRTGLYGLWDRLRGEHKRIQVRNEHEALQAFQRDRAAKDALVTKQSEQRQRLNELQARQEQGFDRQVRNLEDDRKSIEQMKPSSSDTKNSSVVSQRRKQMSQDRKGAPRLDR